MIINPTYTPPPLKRRRNSASSLESGEIRVTPTAPAPKRQATTAPKTMAMAMALSPPFVPPFTKGAFTKALPESRNPVLREKYRAMRLKMNSLYLIRPDSAPIPQGLRDRLHILLNTSNTIGTGGMAVVKKRTYDPRGSLDDIFNIASTGTGMTRLFRKPRPGSEVAIKAQKGPSVRNSVGHLNNETMVMESLQGLDFVPALYATVYDERESTYYLFMEYVQGRTLGDILARETNTRLQQVYKNLNTALIEMWKRGVLHLDLHRANIIVQSDNTVKIIDFGMAHRTRRVENIARAFRTTDNARILWKRYIERYADAMVIKGGFPFYNPNSKILAVMRIMMR